MSTELRTIKTVPELVSVISDAVWQDEWLFRGHEDASWELRPGIARLTPRDDDREAIERMMFREYRRVATPHVRRMPRNDWEWLALAQHHGLPTRLLDWTTNPLAAAFFAVEKPCNTDSVVWCFSHPRIYADESMNPLDIGYLQILRPSHVSPRITGQFGYFTVHPPPYRDLREEPSTVPGQLTAIRIPNLARYQIRAELDRLGVNRASLFPDLDGLATYVRWSHEILNDEPASWPDQTMLPLQDGVTGPEGESDRITD